MYLKIGEAVMYFVDRNRIEERLQYIEENIQLFQKTTSWDSKLAQLALERMVHGVIEAIIDVGNAMIDGFIMRDPGSYEDIIDILSDERVIGEEDADPIKEVIACRKTLVRSYTSVDHVKLEQIMHKNIDVLKQFPDYVRRYLTEELGPVSAFLPEDSKGE